MATELRSLNPHVRIAQVQGAGHGLPFEQPERLGEVVAAFLRQTFTPGAWVSQPGVRGDALKPK